MASLPALHAHWDDVLRHGDDDDVPAILSKPAPRGAPMLSTPSNSVHELHSVPTSMPAATASGRMAHLGPAPAGTAPGWVTIPSSVGMAGSAAGHPVYHYGPGAPAYCPPAAPGAVVPAATAPMVYAQPGYAPASHVTAIVPRPDGGGYYTTSTPYAPMMASLQPASAVGAKEMVSASRDLADGLVRQSLDAEATREASRASVTATSVEMPACTGKRRRRNGWGSEEDGKIIAGYNRYGPRWRAISAGLPGRSDDAVRNRWLRICKVMCPQQPRAAVSTAAEPKSDDEEPPPSSAASTASASGSALQEPEKQKQKPASRQGWNVQEDSIIVQGVHAHGHRWHKIAEMLPTPRTEHAIRNRWHRLGMAAQDGRGGALDAALQIAAAREMLEKQRQRMQASSPVEGDALPSNPLASSLPPAEGVVVGNAVEGETSTFDDDLIGGLSSAHDDIVTPAIA